MQGFTRTIYDDGYKYTMVYPPGWKQGDARQPVVYKERCVPGPTLKPIALIEPRPSGEVPVSQPRSTARSYPLKAYLAQAWMPRYTLGEGVDVSVRYEWPFLRVLSQPPQTRKLYLVQRITDRELRHTFRSLKEVLDDTQLTSVLAEQGKLADLALPDTACASLDEHDALFLDSFRLSTPSDVSKLIQTYPLRAIIKSIKLFLNIPDEHEVCNRLRFDDVNHLSSVRNADLFDLIAMPGRGTHTDELSLLVVTVAPWDIKYDDLELFARAGVPNTGLYSVINGNHLPENVLWAVIWDMCLKHSCRYFILTSYDEWVFGTLSADMHRARVTTHLPAPIFPRAMSVSAKDVTHPRFPVPNVFECLLLWILAAMDRDHTWWPLPPDMPVHVDSSEF